MTFKRSSHAVYECQYHIIWSTKYRKRALTLPHEQEYCEKIIIKAAAEYGMQVLVIEVDIDHVHVQIEIPPQRSVGSGIGILKSVSARMMFKRFAYLKRKFWSGEMWGASYFVRSVGEGVNASMVQRYISKHGERAMQPAQLSFFRQKK